MKLSKISSLLIRFVAAETRFFAAETRFFASTDRSLDRTISESWTCKRESILIDFWTVFSNLQWEWTSLRRRQSDDSKKRCWMTWAHDRSKDVLKALMQAERTIIWLINLLYSLIIIRRASEMTKADIFRKMSRRQFIEYRILISSNFWTYSCLWLIIKRSRLSITIFRSSVNDIKLRFNIACASSFLDVTMMSKCSIWLIKHLTNLHKINNVNHWENMKNFNKFSSIMSNVSVQ
jgi:hypothetical protein